MNDVSVCSFRILLTEILQKMEKPVVKVIQGALRGSVKSDLDSGKFLSFQGIPYAKPPLGQLRFKVSCCCAVARFTIISLISDTIEIYREFRVNNSETKIFEHMYLWSNDAHIFCWALVFRSFLKTSHRRYALHCSFVLPEPNSVWYEISYYFNARLNNHSPVVATV